MLVGSIFKKKKKKMKKEGTWKISFDSLTN